MKKTGTWVVVFFYFLTLPMQVAAEIGTNPNLPMLDYLKTQLSSFPARVLDILRLPEKESKEALKNLELQIKHTSAIADIVRQNQNGTAQLQKFNFAKDLFFGIVDEDVLSLQRFLNQDPTTQVAQTGSGSPGQETDYFGPATRAALIRFQVKNNISPTGFIESRTREILNQSQHHSHPNPNHPRECQTYGEGAYCGCLAICTKTYPNGTTKTNANYLSTKQGAPAEDACDNIGITYGTSDPTVVCTGFPLHKVLSSGGENQ